MDLTIHRHPREDLEPKTPEAENHPREDLEPKTPEAENHANQQVMGGGEMAQLLGMAMQGGVEPGGGGEMGMGQGGMGYFEQQARQAEPQVASPSVVEARRVRQEQDAVRNQTS